MDAWEESTCDALYGDIQLGPELILLSRIPAVQRLRDIRLSNIDSIAMTGIANISRYEHAIGTAYLASQIGMSYRLSHEQFLILQAAALLHDSAITPLGHLVEEALAYLGIEFDHQLKWSLALNHPSEWDLGGVEPQLQGGREAGLLPWAEQIFGENGQRCLADIFATVNGIGRLGRCITGDIDLDNLDNLTRIAFHMGLEVDRGLPLSIARGMKETNEYGSVLFQVGVLEQIESWLKLRHRVYQRLMLSRKDFVGKIMVISAVVRAYTIEDDSLGDPERAWRLSDRQLFERLAQSKDPEIAKTVNRWLNHQLWVLSDLLWMEGGEPPHYTKVSEFNEIVSKELRRACFAYRIKDKRNRRITVNVQGGECISLGENPKQWVLGVGSAVHKDFTLWERKQIGRLATEFFKTPCVATADVSSPETARLFD